MINTDDGSTLLELLIVIAIISLLVVLFLPRIIEVRTEAQKAAAQAWARQILTAAQLQIADERKILGFSTGSTAKSVPCTTGIITTLPAPLQSPALDASQGCKVNSDGAVAVKFTIGGRDYSWSSVVNKVIMTDAAFIDTNYF